MKKLIEVYGVVIISIITGAVIFACLVDRVIGAKDFTNNYYNTINNQYETGSFFKAPIFENVAPLDNRYSTDDATRCDWEYLLRGYLVTDNKGNNITDNVVVSIFRLLDTENTQQIKWDNNELYLGTLTKNSNVNIADLDTTSIDKNGNITTDVSEYYVTSLNDYLNNTDKILAFSGKYKFVYQVIDSSGYKAELSTACIVESDGITSNTYLYIDVESPLISSIHTSTDKYDISTELSKIQAYIIDSNRNKLRAIDYETQIFLLNPNTMEYIPVTDIHAMDISNKNEIIIIKVIANDLSKSINKTYKIKIE